MNVKITNLKDTKINGVKAAFKDDFNVYKEDFFEWTAFTVVSKFKTDEIMCGLLQGWHHTPNFSEVEYHTDKELFCFTEGTALMLFCDIVDGVADYKTSQIVRIEAGTELEIEAGKAHFVAVAEGETFKAMVISPVQEAPRLSLAEEVCGE